MMNKIKTNLPKIPGRAYLLLAIIIFAAANSVMRKLTEIGAQNLVAGRNPISFCNVMFAGNLCALIVLILIYRRQWNVRTLKQFSRKDWLSLTAVGILAGALAPALIFMALSLTMVNSVVLIGRIEPPIVLALSVLFLKERVNRWVVTGAIVSFVGVAITILLQNPGQNGLDMGGGISIGKGELMAAGGAVTLAISTIISKITLREIPLGIFTIYRTAVGLLVFFVIAIQLFGPNHFMDVFSPLLWQWMLFYGTIIVVGGQLCWLTGLKISGAPDVSLASSFSPIAGILAAYIILKEVPTFAQYIGGSVIVCGIAFNQIGVWQKNEKPTLPSKGNSLKEMDMEVGFKGL